MNIEPETELPWEGVECDYVWKDGFPVHASCQDREFIIHACNAYEGLKAEIERLKNKCSSQSIGLGDHPPAIDMMHRCFL